ncbi:hypothetical protein D770_20430 [Flammeovirgaceae bacterium 311]|nr:hypothetical protein D770_20430 [Flammeovirgaceae bacterium 311]
MQNAVLETSIQDDGGATIYTPWTTGYKNLMEYIANHNERIREAKADGEVLPADAKIIRNGLGRTIEFILRLYIKQLSELNRLDRIKVTDLPPFRTYTPSLATCLGVTDKTIQNHRRALVQAGIITAEENHGAFGLRIWLNPTLFLKDFVQKLWREEAAAESPENMPSNNAILAPFPSSESTETKNLRPLGPELQDPEKKIGPVNKGVFDGVPEPGQETSAEPEQPAAGQASAQDRTSVPCRTTRKGEGNLGQMQPQPSPGVPQKMKKNCAGGGGAAATAEELAERQHWRQFGISMVEDFWLYSKQRLYPYKKFIPLDEKVIKNFIWNNVFGGFPRSGTHNDYRQYLKQCKQRIDMAHNYLMSHPGFSILDPDKYFGDQDMQGSFHRTVVWYQNKERSRIMARVYAEADKFRKGTLTKGYKGNKYKPTLHQLYADHCQYISSYGNSEMLEQFKGFVAQNPGFYAGYSKAPKNID